MWALSYLACLSCVEHWVVASINTQACGPGLVGGDLPGCSVEGSVDLRCSKIRSILLQTKYFNLAHLMLTRNNITVFYHLSLTVSVHIEGMCFILPCLFCPMNNSWSINDYYYASFRHTCHVLSGRNHEVHISSDCLVITHHGRRHALCRSALVLSTESIQVLVHIPAGHSRGSDVRHSDFNIVKACGCKKNKSFYFGLL